MRQYNLSGSPGIVEFFRSTLPNGASASGYASGVLESAQNCAFDIKSNSFVDGTALTGGQKIAYLIASQVNLPNKTLVDSGLGIGSFWSGMFSRVNSPANDTLSVGIAVGSSSTEVINTYPISGSITFGTPTTCTLTNYPVTTDPLYQLAPSTGGTTGRLYDADYGDSAVLQASSACSPSSAVSTFKGISSVTGVATYPRGQY